MHDDYDPVRALGEWVLWMFGVFAVSSVVLLAIVLINSWTGFGFWGFI